eukprot:m.438339 g.438339  ORF g.438339 m.438339 type:complete len:368 (-) comp18226_c0_seq1:3640-4743(-)
MHPLFEGLTPKETSERKLLCVYLFAALTAGFYSCTPSDLSPAITLGIALLLAAALCGALWKVLELLLSPQENHQRQDRDRDRTPSRRPEVPSSDGTAPPLPTTSGEAVSWINSCSESDPYRMLCVTKSASQAEIKKAFRQLSLKTHPDKTDAKGAEEAFKKLAKASYILSDEERRADFDREVEESNEMENFMQGEMFDLFEDLKKRSSEIRCDKCFKVHPKARVARPAHAARYCLDSDSYLSSQHGDVWAETEMVFLWHFYMNDKGAVYEVTDWAICHGLDRTIEPNSSKVVVRWLSENPESRKAPKSRKKKGRGRAQADVSDFIDEEDFAAFLAALIRHHQEGGNFASGADFNPPPTRKRKGKKKR